MSEIEQLPRPKLINPGRDVVRESLEGLVATNPGLRLLEGENCVFRHDFRQHISTGKVCIVSGGGSGHEPALCGMVGAGFLTGAVAGPVFTSPPPNQVLIALRKLSTNNTAGILVIIMNYTGDRLNFGLAVERYKLEFGNKKIALLVVAEDTAIIESSAAGKRGLCGGIALMKIAGAMAESGKGFVEICAAVEFLKDQMATIGVSLSSCSLPNSQKFLFRLEPGKMELGLGIHGEAGASRVDVGSCETVIKNMMDHLRKSFWYTRDEKFIILVNNLGGISQIEMGIVCKNLLDYMDKCGVNVTRLYNGRFLTSLDMAGFSITLLRPATETLHWLDEPTSCPNWVVPYTTKNCFDRITPPCLPLLIASSESRKQGPPLREEDVGPATKLMRSALQCLLDKKELLNELDSVCGDGDCGSCMQAGASAIISLIDADELFYKYPAKAFIAMADCAETRMGGTSGAIYSLFLNAIASHLLTYGTKELSATKKLVTRCLKEGTEHVMLYGGAQRGDRTMVDVLLAALDCLEADQSYVEIVAETDKTVAATILMKPRAGRASYVNDQLIKKPDAGAMAVFIWMESFCKGVCHYNETRL